VKGEGDGAGSARAILKLKIKHIIVLQALEDANRSHERVVVISEIAEEISDKDKKRLERTYSNDLGKIISKILGLLSTRGIVFSPGCFHRRRSYGSVHLFDPNDTSPPDTRSRRCRVLGLVREAVQKLGRAVRSADVLEHVASSELAERINEANITHDVLSLAKTGELAVVGHVRGEGKGCNLYLPSDMDADLYRPKRPLTWLDEVAQTVETLWADCVEEAKVKGRLPKPLTTGDIRARVVNSPFHTQYKIKKNPQVLVDAVKNLAGKRDPLLRKIKRRGQKALLWVPVGVEDKEVDFGAAYASDAERMCKAVERAVKRLGRPVSARDVKDEVERDFSLQPAGASSVYEALADASKETVDAGNGRGRQKRVTHHCYTIGRVGRDTYYYTSNAPEARAYVSFRQLELRWSAAGYEEQLNALGTCSLLGVAEGRAMLLLKEAEIFRQDLAELLASRELEGATKREAEDLGECVEKTAELTRQWLISTEAQSLRVPADVVMAVPGWTAEELLHTLKPLYPQAQTITSTAKFIQLMDGCIRRVPNPSFESRFAKESRLASEFLYDRADALLYTAKQWGGPECSLQAMLASHELGRLRDPRFVFPALNAKSFETRLAAVACLAFLWSDEGNNRLKSLAEGDPDPGVRQSALWAYGFAGGEGAREMLNDKARNDANNRVREFASQALGAGDGSWWKM
jgi:hypothetical protein